MKHPRRLFLALPLLGVTVWWLWPAAPPQPVPFARSQPSPQADLPPAVLTPDEPAEPLPEPAPPPDPQLHLHTAIADMADLIRTGDSLAFLIRYKEPQQLAGMMGTPEGFDYWTKALIVEVNTPGTDMHKLSLEIAQLFDTLKTMEPTLNEAGDFATYPINNYGPEYITTFKKINGRWYDSGPALREPPTPGEPLPR
jgi:hypothetical protein